MSPRALAVRWTCERFVNCIFWTFTFKTPHTPEEGAKKWNNLARAIKREWPEARLVRVFEMHPGGHGLHVHAVTPLYMRAQRMWDISKRVGFGRIDVVAWDTKRGMQAGEYLAKYLSKKRPECLKRRRLYGFVGIPNEDCTLQKDIKFCSPMIDVWSLMKHHPSWVSLRFTEKASLCRRVLNQWLVSDPDELAKLAMPDGRAAAGRLGELSLVILGTIQQGTETIRAACGLPPEIGASLRIKLARAEESRLKAEAWELAHPNQSAKIDHEIQSFIDERDNLERARNDGILIPF